MTTIINEFEIVPPADAGTAGSAPDARERPNAGQGAAAAIQPVDIEAILQHSAQRWLRVWAD